MPDNKKWNHKNVDDRKREAEDRLDNVERQVDKVVDRLKDQLQNDLSVPNGRTDEERK